MEGAFTMSTGEMLVFPGDTKQLNGYLACTDERLNAIAPFYVVNPRPLEAVARLCPVVGSYPDKDFTTAAGQKLDGALDTYHVSHDMKIYPGVKHSFFNDQRSRYNPEAA